MSELSNRLWNAWEHSGDPDTVAEAAATLENLDFVCKAQEDAIMRLASTLEGMIKHIDRLEELCRMQADDIERLRQGIDKWAVSSRHQPMTDEQVRKVIAAALGVANG